MRTGKLIALLTVISLCVLLASCSITYHDKQLQKGAVSINNHPFWYGGAGGSITLDEDGSPVFGFAAGTEAELNNPTPAASLGDDTSGTGATASAPRTSGTAGSGDVATRQGSGNVSVSVGQNDGVEQESRGTAEAAANVNSAGSTNTRTLKDK